MVSYCYDSLPRPQPGKVKLMNEKIVQKLAVSCALMLGIISACKSTTPAPQTRLTVVPTEIKTTPIDQQKELDKYRVVNNRKYTIGVEDVIEVFVHNDKSLTTTQGVSPDGIISVPLAGEVLVVGLELGEVRKIIVEKLKKYFVRPQVNVVVKEYNSRKVYVLGEVKKPGVYHLSSGMDLLEAVSLAEGITDKAYLTGSYMIRDGEFVPVDFNKLINYGDMAQNVPMSSKDIIYIDDISAQKVFVLGEVKNPGINRIKDQLSILGAITEAGGFAPDAVKSEVILIRGGMADPSITKINVEEMLQKGVLSQNVMLQRDDIIFVPEHTLATWDRYFRHITQLFMPFAILSAGVNRSFGVVAQ